MDDDRIATGQHRREILGDHRARRCGDLRGDAAAGCKRDRRSAERKRALGTRAGERIGCGIGIAGKGYADEVFSEHRLQEPQLAGT